MRVRQGGLDVVGDGHQNDTEGVFCGYLMQSKLVVWSWVEFCWCLHFCRGRPGHLIPTRLGKRDLSTNISLPLLTVPVLPAQSHTSSYIPITYPITLPLSLRQRVWKTNKNHPFSETQKPPPRPGQWIQMKTQARGLRVGLEYHA